MTTANPTCMQHLMHMNLIFQVAIGSATITSESLQLERA